MNDAPRRANQLRQLIPVLILAVSFCVSQSAYAAKRAKLMVLQVQSDDLNESTRAAITEALRERVGKDKRFTLMDTPKTDFFELMMDAECTDVDAACLTLIGKKLGAQRVVYVSGKKVDSGTELTLTYVNVASRKATKTASWTADSPKKLGAIMANLVDPTVGSLPKPKPKVVAKPQKRSRVPVELTANIKGATVYLNGMKVGKTPVRRPLKPGTYRVKIKKKGFITLSQKLRVKGDKLNMNFTLKEKPSKTAKARPVTPQPVVPPVTPPRAEQDRPFYSQWWFWTAVGVGVAGIATTAVLLSTDDKPVSHGVVNFGMAAPDYDPAVLEAQ